MNMHSHRAACKSAVPADTAKADECRVGVKLRPFLKSLFPFSSMPKFINHMAIVKLNSYVFGANYVDLVASL